MAKYRTSIHSNNCANCGQPYYDHNILTDDATLYHNCPKPVRQENWKQDNPRDQAVVITGSIEGWLGNLENGFTDPQRACSFIQENLNQLKNLIKFLPDNW